MLRAIGWPKLLGTPWKALFFLSGASSLKFWALFRKVCAKLHFWPLGQFFFARRVRVRCAQLRYTTGWGEGDPIFFHLGEGDQPLPFTFLFRPLNPAQPIFFLILCQAVRGWALGRNRFLPRVRIFSFPIPFLCIFGPPNFMNFLRRDGKIPFLPTFQTTQCFTLCFFYCTMNAISCPKLRKQNHHYDILHWAVFWSGIFLWFLCFFF